MSAAPQDRHLVILGLMGVGKSTTARAVAQDQGRICHDSDHDLEAVFGLTGAELADSYGVDELHRLESAMLLGRLASQEPSVISAAAWIVEDERCHDALARRAHVVVLHANIDEILRRAESGDHRRKIDETELRALHERRSPLFAQVANLDLDATWSTEALVEAIRTAFF